MPAVRGSVAPLVRRALDLLAAGDPGVGPLVTADIPAAMARRLEPGRLAATGAIPETGRSALVLVSGAGIGGSRIAVLLHPGGARYTMALATEAGALPAGLVAGLEGLDRQPPAVAEGDTVAAEWLARSAATLTRHAAELSDDHRWWGDLGSLIMLADLVQDGSPGA